MDRLVKTHDPELRGKSFFMRSDYEVDSAFERIRDATRREDKKGISWYAGKAKAHLAYDYSGSEFLSRMGVSVRDQFAVATVCNDLILLVELPVVGSDRQVYDRNECKSSSLRSLPLPAEIREYCDLIRSTKPVTGYFDSWVGFDGSSIREITPADFETESFDAGFIAE